MVDSSPTAHESEKNAIDSPRPTSPPAEPPVKQDSMDEFLDRLEARSMVLMLSDQDRLAQKARARSTQVLMVGVLIALWLSTLVLAVAYIRVNNHSQQVVQRIPFHAQVAVDAPKPVAMDYVIVPTPAAAQPSSPPNLLSATDGTASYFKSPSQNSEEFTASHYALPFGTHVRVTNVANGRSVVVTITRRSSSHKNLVINVSESAAAELGFWKAGSARVHLELLTN